MNYNEQALPELLTADLDHSFKQLVLYYQDALYAFALRLSGSTQDAEDIVQEALLGAYVTLSQYPPARIRALKLRPWLYKLTLNIFRNSKRGLQLLTIPLDLFEDSSALAMPDAEKERPDFLYEDAERLQELASLLGLLPEHYRVVVICYYFEDLSYLEIAGLLDQPLGTIKSRLHRGIQLLRQHLQLQEQKGSMTHGS